MVHFGAFWVGLLTLGLAHDSGLESEPPLVTVWANNPDNKLLPESLANAKESSRQQCM